MGLSATNTKLKETCEIVKTISGYETPTGATIMGDYDADNEEKILTQLEKILAIATLTDCNV